MNFKVHIPKCKIEEVINEKWIKEFKKFSEEIDNLEDELGKELIETMKKVAFITKEEDFSSYYQKKKSIYLHPQILNIIKE